MRKPGIIVVTVVAVAFAASVTTLSANAADIVVDLGQTIGPATGRASGFLHAMSASEPGPSLVEAIKPKLFRMGGPDFANDGSGAWANYDRVRAMGARMQVVMSESHGYAPAGWWPSDAGAMPKWDAIVDVLLATARAGDYVVEWDIWNEPNSGFWGRSRAEFFDTWRHTVRRIRTQSPSAVIVGPSISGFDQEWLESFLQYGKANDVMPDKVSWHEFGPPARIPAHVAGIRHFMISEGMGIKPISLNEIIDGETLLPGFTVQYLANLERAMVDGACHACWDEPDNVNACANHSLDGILTQDRKPRSVWWAYKAYSELAGVIVPIKPSATIDGMACWDAQQQTIRILLGRNGLLHSPVTISLANMETATHFSSNSAVTVVAELIPGSGINELPAPTTVINSTFRLKDDLLAIEIPDFGAHDACWITVRPAEAGR
jgi:hypothetical protein